MKRKYIAILIGAIFFAGISDFSHAFAPTGNDVVTLNDPDANQVHNLTGCTIYLEESDENEITAICNSVITTSPSIVMIGDNTPIYFGAEVDPSFEWLPFVHSCILKNTFDMVTFTAYDVECGTPLFANGFESYDD